MPQENVRDVSTGVFIETERLILRGWQSSDAAGYCRLNADEEVMEFFPATLTEKESLAHINRMKRHIAEKGYGLFALERKQDGAFIGFTGLSTPGFDAFFTPCTEIGWRLDKKYWNKGYASEAAGACLRFGFEELKLDRIYSFTAVSNTRSENVMKRIGMHHAGFFEHPLLAETHPLRRHVLYKLEAPL
ncbi:MAG: GNAT family N-acetyltransferase [Chitinophagaceae bacterium]|nr:GNAT family N-acetyltransferase [Chitinophagaceae bacterium]